MQSPGDVGDVEEGTDAEVVATRGENIRENWSHMFVVFCHLVGQKHCHCQNVKTESRRPGRQGLQKWSLCGGR